MATVVGVFIGRRCDTGFSHVGSYCDLRIGGYTVHSQKYRISNELLSLFAETDKVQGDYALDRPTTSTDVSEDNDFHGYSSSVAAIADRLDLMGFTAECAKADFSSLLGQEIEEKLQLAEELSDKADEDGLYERLRTSNQNEARFLSVLPFEAWIEAVRRIKSEGVEWVDYDADHRKSIFSRQLDAIEAHVLNESQDDEHPPLGFYCSDLRFMIRAFLPV